MNKQDKSFFQAWRNGDPKGVKETLTDGANIEAKESRRYGGESGREEAVY